MEGDFCCSDYCLVSGPNMSYLFAILLNRFSSGSEGLTATTNISSPSSGSKNKPSSDCNLLSRWFLAWFIRI
jgi:hypothetical protein